MSGKMTKEQEEAVNRILMAKRAKENASTEEEDEEEGDEEDIPPTKKKKGDGIDLNAIVGDLDVPSLVEGFTKDQENTVVKLDKILAQNASIETKLNAIAAVLKQIVPLLEAKR